jgi:hypothetical protein
MTRRKTQASIAVVGTGYWDDTAPWPEKLQLYPHAVEWDGRVPVARKAERLCIEIRQAEPLREECQQFLECIEIRNPARRVGWMCECGENWRLRSAFPSE